MTEPPLERWLADEHADPELRRLLEAGSNEKPRSQALRASLVITALLSAQTAAAAAPVAQGAARHAIGTAVLKWFAGGVVISAAALSASQALEPAPRAVTPVVQSSLPAARPRVAARPRASVRLAPPPATSAESTASAPEPSLPPVQVPTARADVAREVALLDAARHALLQGNARRALDALAGFERLPARSLVPEATVLRVRALLALNDEKTARKVAARFVAAAPGSPQASVLRGLFAEPLEANPNDSTSSGREPAIQTGSSRL